MTWHATHQTEEGSMYNPSDAEAWKHFDQMYPDFAEELHNVRLGLYAVGFAPHEELLQLWHVGVRTYGHATDRDFIMRATLMWTANDLTAYGMASGWSTVGRNKKAFMKNRVENKVAYLRLTGDQILDCVANISPAVEIPLLLPNDYGSDHKWTKKNIFWDLLYWSILLIQYNLDVMHIAENVFDNIFNTVMDIKGKRKDNMNAHKNLKIICNHPELEFDERTPNVMPKKLILIAFREMLPEHVWNALTKVILLFQSICSTTLDVHKLHELENSVSIILCNLEKIFSPAFFDSMEHLIVHLPYEARVEGPVQYRWMYPFERASGATKKRWLSGPEWHIIETYLLTTVTQYYDAEVTSVYAYFVNGYNFQTERYNTGKSTMNCEVDPIQGMKVRPSYHLVDVNFKKLYQKDDPFILAQQAIKVPKYEEGKSRLDGYLQNKGSDSCR
ncbi:UNVERIFIED_CONTAM: hypothetical protein Scaly_2937100 [Sesamum calycinum]|uniref:DUF4218 domain-containing protein n=1 Tax=Sesamum calycinum TaxID=2727403 RepID=A0AAW2KTP4_9LAMI